VYVVIKIISCYNAQICNMYTHTNFECVAVRIPPQLPCQTRAYKTGKVARKSYRHHALVPRVVKTCLVNHHPLIQL